MEQCTALKRSSRTEGPCNGWITNVAPTTNLHSSPSDTEYGATKAVLIGFIKSLVKDYTEGGVLTNVGVPSVTATALSLNSAERRLLNYFSISVSLYSRK